MANATPPQRVKGIDFHPTEPWILSMSPDHFSTQVLRALTSAGNSDAV